MIISGSLRVVANGSFLWLCSVAWESQSQTRLSDFVSLSLDHIFTHLPVAGHVGCFHVLVIISSAAINTRVHVSFNYSFVWIYDQAWDR